MLDFFNYIGRVPLWQWGQAGMEATRVTVVGATSVGEAIARAMTTGAATARAMTVGVATAGATTARYVTAGDVTAGAATIGAAKKVLQLWKQEKCHNRTSSKSIYIYIFKLVLERNLQHL